VTELRHKSSEIRVLQGALDRSLRDGRQWLQSRIVPAGAVRKDRLFKFFGKPTWGLWLAGASPEAIGKILDHVAAQAVQPTGDFHFAEEPLPGDGGFSVYPALYCLIAAAGIRHPLARDSRVLARLVQHQSERTGAVFNTIGPDPAKIVPDPFHASLVTCTSTHLFLRLGLADRAMRAGEFLAGLVEANRIAMKEEGVFYTQVDIDGRLIARDGIPANKNWCHLVSNRQPKQEFWQIGAIMGALARLSGWLLDRPSPDLAAARRFLNPALELLNFELTMLPEGYEWPQKCKVAWGGGELLQTCLRHLPRLPEAKERLAPLYRITRNTVVSTFLDSQGPDGFWMGDHYPLSDDAPEFDYDYKLLRGVPNAPLQPTGSTTCVWATPEELTGEFLGEMAIAAAGIRALSTHLGA